MTPSDIEIARAAKLSPISDIASGLSIPTDKMIPYGYDKAKIHTDFLESLEARPDGKLILVTAISPTPAGEGKTTTTVGLGDALNRIGKRTIICLREPSLGPCFGVKGGAAGGGYAQLVPMEDINLHFTGDFHAIGTAHNLLSAFIDNHIYWSNQLNFDARRISWRRVVDMNDRALRDIVSGLGGIANGFARQTGFDITVASEVMAVFCLARNLRDLEERLGRIIVGRTRDNAPIHANALEAHGAMTVLLKHAFMPNLVQTLENNPALVHGGPFANIAHGCNSVVATRSALKMADYVVTEAGFGADLGAEKFFNIKCVKAGLSPSATVIVATVRALKMHGGVARNSLGAENVEAVERGLVNLRRHIDNMRQFGVPIVVAINRFTSDSNAECAAITNFCRAKNVESVMCTHWAEGSKGAEQLARTVSAELDREKSDFKPLYDLNLGLAEKIDIIARKIYGASSTHFSAQVQRQLNRFEDNGYANVPICMAKTQYSFSTDPAALGAPEGHEINVREVRLAAGAEFVVAICGDIMTMPGLPRVPAGTKIHLNSAGQIEGLF